MRGSFIFLISLIYGHGIEGFSGSTSSSPLSGSAGIFNPIGSSGIISDCGIGGYFALRNLLGDYYITFLIAIILSGSRFIK